MNKFFKLEENGTTVGREIMAGLTTFFAMSYILFVNPQVLGTTGMPVQAVFLATILASIVGTLAIALIANVPYALAPGMGLNAFFAYTVVLSLGYTWQEALAMVFICGIINIIITFTSIRKAIIHRLIGKVYNTQLVVVSVFSLPILGLKMQEFCVLSLTQELM